jgi:glycosyltransferase involved in cell wall biosynthesis
VKLTLLLPNIEISGGNRANFELANALHALGHEVTVYYPLVPGRDGLGWLNLRKSIVQVVKGVRNTFSALSWFDLKANIQSVVTFSRGNLIEALPEADYLVFSWWAHAELVSQLPVGKGVPVHLIRSLEYWGGPEPRVTAAYEKRLIKVVTSEHLRQQYESRFGEVAGIVSDAIDLETFKPARRQSKEPIQVGMMYRRQTWKRMSDGIEVLKRVQAKHPEVKVTLFGEALKADDRRALTSLDYEYVRFPTGQTLVDIYQRLSVFLFTSGPEEAFGLPPLEAMACGCPVVATRVGAVEAYSVNHETCLHCRVGDIEAMVLAVESLVLDPSKRERIGSAASDSVQSMDWASSANRFSEVVQSAVAQHDP